MTNKTNKTIETRVYISTCLEQNELKGIIEGRNEIAEVAHVTARQTETARNLINDKQEKQNYRNKRE